MDTKSIEKKEGKVSFQVVVDAAAFEAAVNQAYLKNKKSIAIPGFRKGKAPRQVIEGMYGKDVFHDEAVDSLALEAYQSGVKETGEKTVGDPAITDYKVEDDKSLTITFEAALYPEATLGEYKGLTAYKMPVEVTEAEIDAEIEGVRKRNARIVTVDREAKTGDTVVIDFDGFKDGKRFSGGKGSNYNLTLGSNTFVPGFEDQLVGVKAGDEKDVNITFPKEYAEELAGADAVFKVKVHEVQETQLPELDDEFAKDVSEFDTLAEYRDSIRKEQTERKQERADNEFREVVLKKAADNMTVEIPDAMVNARVNDGVENLARRVAAQGMRLEQYFQMMGMNEQMYRTYMRPAATQDVRTELLLEKVAEVEGLEAAAEEIEAEYKTLSERYDMDLEAVKKAAPEDMVARDVKLRKAGDLIVAAAVATDKPETPEKKDEEAPAEEKAPEAE